MYNSPNPFSRKQQQFSKDEILDRAYRGIAQSALESLDLRNNNVHEVRGAIAANPILAAFVFKASGWQLSPFAQRLAKDTVPLEVKQVLRKSFDDDSIEVLSAVVSGYLHASSALFCHVSQTDIINSIVEVPDLGMDASFLVKGYNWEEDEVVAVICDHGDGLGSYEDRIDNHCVITTSEDALSRLHQFSQRYAQFGLVEIPFSLFDDEPHLSHWTTVMVNKGGKADVFRSLLRSTVVTSIIDSLKG